MGKNRLTPLQCIRKFCLTCQGGSYKRVANCETKDCFLWDYRSGHNPFKKKRAKISILRGEKGKFIKDKVGCQERREVLSIASTDEVKTVERGLVSISETQNKITIEVEKEK